MKKPLRKYVILLGIAVALFLVYSMQVPNPAPRLTSGDSESTQDHLPTRLSGTISTAILRSITQ